MRNFYPPGILFFLLMFLSSTSLFAGYGYFGDCSTFIQINGQFYQVDGCPGSPDPSINATNLGTVSALTINYIEQQTWENSGDDVKDGIMAYRIYETGMAPTGFIDINLTSFTDLGGGNEKRFASPALDVYAGLAAGTDYTFEFYYRANIEWNDGDPDCDDTIFESNGGANFSFGFTTEVVPTPISLIDFSAANRSSNIQLSWTTASEANSSHFEIERSSNGSQWNGIGSVAAARNSSILRSYSFVDETPIGGINYYRLKQIDLDNTFEYSAAIRVKHDAGIQINIFPNPATEFITISSSKKNAIEKINILNPAGQLLFAQSFNGSFQENISLAGMPSGQYCVQVFEKNDRLMISKVLVVQ